MLQDQGYLRAFFKFLGYLVLAVTVFFILLFATQDKDEVESFFAQTDITEQIYDYWDWKRFQEDFIDVQFTGHMDLYFTGDTSGLGLDARYYQYYMETRFKEHFGEPTPYINLDNLELVEKDEDVRALAENAAEREVMVQECEIVIRWLGFGPVLYKVIVRAGTEYEKGVYESSYINLGSSRKLNMSLEHGIDRELKIWAKRFYKIHGNEEQLEELYMSIYMK